MFHFGSLLMATFYKEHLKIVQGLYGISYLTPLQDNWKWNSTALLKKAQPTSLKTGRGYQEVM